MGQMDHTIALAVTGVGTEVDFGTGTPHFDLQSGVDPVRQDGAHRLSPAEYSSLAIGRSGNDNRGRVSAHSQDRRACACLLFHRALFAQFRKGVLRMRNVAYRAEV